MPTKPCTACKQLRPVEKFTSTPNGSYCAVCWRSFLAGARALELDYRIIHEPIEPNHPGIRGKITLVINASPDEDPDPPSPASPARPARPPRLAA